MGKKATPLLIALEENRSALTRFLRLRLGCEDAADDVLQSLSEKLLGDRETTTINNRRAYLFRAAANAAHSQTRKDRVRSANESAAAAGNDLVDDLDPERTLIGNETLEVVQYALSELPLLTQRIFIDFKVNGEAQKSIAERYGVSLSTVEKRLAKAVVHCQRRIEATSVSGDARARDLVRESTQRKGRR
ncbi:MAG: sigma-70 family RNA polymerase sigma factor [Pseudomonadota bacterium]